MSGAADAVGGCRSRPPAESRRRVRLLMGGAAAPAFNLALDEALLHGEGAVVRLYEWEPPGLSLGYFQKFAELDLAPIERRGFVVVRRPTGGGAIAHIDELTFCIADDVGGGFFDADVRAGYRRIHRAFAAALLQLGASTKERGEAPLVSDEPSAEWLCFYKSSSVDLEARGRKLLGSAQRRVGRRVMHHGSLPLRPNPVTPGAANVAGELGRAVAAGEVAAALVDAFEAEFDCQLVADSPTRDELDRAALLVAEKYGQAIWTRAR